MKDAKNLLDSMLEKDERPKNNGWASGWYLNVECNECHQPYLGDKRSVTCAACAYVDKSMREV